MPRLNIIYTRRSPARVLAIVSRGTKRVRKRYANALVCCAGSGCEGYALAMTSDGFGIVATIQDRWWRWLLVTADGRREIAYPAEAVQILRNAGPLALQSRSC